MLPSISPLPPSTVTPRPTHALCVHLSVGVQLFPVWAVTRDTSGRILLVRSTCGGGLAWRGGTPAPVVSGGQPCASVGAPRAHPGRHQGDTPQASRSCPRRPQLLVSAWRSLLVLVILGHVGGPHGGFNCVFLSSGDAEHLHACMFAPCVSRLAKHLFTSFAHLRNWVICFPTCEFSRGLDLSPAALLLVAAKGPPVPGGVTQSSPRGLCPEGPLTSEAD